MFWPSQRFFSIYAGPGCSPSNYIFSWYSNQYTALHKRKFSEVGGCEQNNKRLRRYFEIVQYFEEWILKITAFVFHGRSVRNKCAVQTKKFGICSLNVLSSKDWPSYQFVGQGWRQQPVYFNIHVPKGGFTHTILKLKRYQCVWSLATLLHLQLTHNLVHVHTHFWT
jgi:hypothetical protein